MEKGGEHTKVSGFVGADIHQVTFCVGVFEKFPYPDIEPLHIFFFPLLRLLGHMLYLHT